MDLAAGPGMAACALLLLTGAPKVWQPSGAVRAMRSVGWHAPWAAGRLLGIAECSVAAATLIVGGTVLWSATAALYVAFAAFIVIAMTRGGTVASCGCAGRRDTPPTRAHVLLNLLLAGFCALAAVEQLSAANSLADTGTGTAIALTLYAGIIAWFGWLVLAVLPQSRAA